MRPQKSEALMPDQPPRPVVSKPKGSERRTSRRHTNLATHHRLVAAVGDDFVLAKIRNISPEGISLILGRPIEPGATLSVDLIDTTTNRFSRTLQVRVIYSVEHPTGDYILGGSFDTKLTSEELHTFLR